MLFGIRWGSLRWKIIAWSFVPTAIILAAVALVGFFAYEQVTENLTISNSRELARLSAGQLANEIAEYGKVLTAVARTDELTQPSTRNSALVKASNRLAIFDAGVMMLDSTGIVVAVEPARSELIGQDWSSREIFSEMLRSPGTIFSQVDLPNNQRLIVVAVPITGAHGELLGTLNGMFKMSAASVSSFYGSIVKLRLGASETAYLVNKRGAVLYHTDSDHIGEDFAGQSVVSLLAAGKSGAFRTRDFAGNEIVASYALIPGTPWGLVIEQNWLDLLTAGPSYAPFLILLIILGLVVPAIVVLIGTEKITQPIAQLIDATQAVAGGNLGREIAVHTGDELEELGKHFNRMSVQLADSYRALKEREERLGLVLEGTNDGIWDWDLRTNQVYYSPRWKSMLGFADDEIPNRYESWRNLIHPDDLERSLAHVQAELDGTALTYELEHRLRHKDGSYRWILARGTTLRDADGKPYRMAGSHTDITERQQTASALRESEERFRATFEQAAVGIAHVAPDGHWLWVNQRLCDIVGYTRDELLQKNFQELTHPDDLQIDLDYLRQMLANERQSYTLEKRYLRKDGSIIWINLNVSPVRDDAGNPKYIVSVLQDITERKRAEETLRQSEIRFAQVFHANPLPISITALEDGRYIDVNDAWLRLFGYARDKVIGKTSLGLSIWVKPEQRTDMIQQLAATGSVHDFEHLAHTQSGEIRDVLVSAEVIELNNTRYNLSLVHDITERKRAEENIRRHNAYLEALHQVTLGVMRELDVTELLETIVQRAVDLIGATYGWVYLVAPEQAVVELKVATGTFNHHVGAQLKRGEGLAGYIWQTGEAFAVTDYQVWSGRSPQFDGDPVHSAIGAPLKSGAQVTGVIGLTRTVIDTPFQPEEIDLMTRFANLASIALQNASLHTSLQIELNERKRAETALEERLVFERLITNISTEFINLESDEIDSGIEQALAAIGRFTGSDRSYIMLFSPDGTRMEDMCEWCRTGITPLKSLYPHQSNLLPWTSTQIKQGQVVHIPVLDDLPPDAAHDRKQMQSHADAPLSFINVPLSYHTQVIGLLGFDSVRANKTWSEDSIALLRIVGEIFVNALEHKRAAEALRKSESRFRTMFENASVGIAITDMSDEVVQVNPALGKMLGYSPEELRRLRTRDYTYADDYPAQMVLEDQVSAGKRDQYQIEKRYVRQDGQIVWGRMIRSVVRDAHGKILYRIGMIEDITEQKQAARKLEDAYRTLELRVAERTHELATLNAIAASVSRSLNLNEIMADALEKMMELTAMEHGVAYRTSGDEEGAADTQHAHLRVMAYRGLSDEFAHFGDGLPLRESAAGIAGQQGEPMIWSLAELPTHSSLKQMLAREGVVQVISIPLMAKGHFVGALNLSTNRLHAFPPEQIALLKAIGQQVGVAVENARLYEQAERSAQVAERSRLARELHDSVTQSLYSMTLYAEAAARLLTTGHQEQAAGHLRDLRDTAQEALREMRLLIFELRPPALESGLAVALQTRLDSVESRGGIHAELHVQGQENLTFAMQAVLYNIALEALNNALKHAQARRVQVNLHFEETAVAMDIIDDGEGFEPAIARLGGGFGISGMHERAQRIGGKLEFTSAPHRGTRVHILVPLIIETGES